MNKKLPKRYTYLKLCPYCLEHLRLEAKKDSVQCGCKRTGLMRCKDGSVKIIK